MHYYRKLPHFDNPGAVFFVTVRLAHTIPVPIARQLVEERQSLIHSIQQDDLPDKSTRIYAIEKMYFERYEGLLDSATYGDRWLTEAGPVAEMKRLLHDPDVIHYLLAYIVMSNHMHFLVDMRSPLPDEKNSKWGYFSLSQLLKRIKGRSAVALNRLRGKRGAVWAEESYDRYIRNEKHFWRALDYLKMNSVKSHCCAAWADYEHLYISPVVREYY